MTGTKLSTAVSKIRTAPRDRSEAAIDFETVAVAWCEDGEFAVPDEELKEVK